MLRTNIKVSLSMRLPCKSTLYRTYTDPDSDYQGRRFIARGERALYAIMN